MFKSKLFILSFLVFISHSVFSEELVFNKNERHSTDIERDSQSKGLQVVELAKLKEGMVVADVLGGGGYYSEIISAKVGTHGKVFLHNNKAYMPYVEKELVARLANNRLPNVIRHDRETEDLDLGDDSLDAAFFILGYHDLYHVAKDWKIDKDDFLQQIERALKSKGKLIIVDHSAKQGTNTEHSQVLHRIDKDYVVKELTAKGYKLVNSSNILANPNDDRTISPFKPEMRRKTDRFVLVFEKKI